MYCGSMCTTLSFCLEDGRLSQKRIWKPSADSETSGGKGIIAALDLCTLSFFVYSVYCLGQGMCHAACFLEIPNSEIHTIATTFTFSTLLHHLPLLPPHPLTRPLPHELLLSSLHVQFLYCSYTMMNYAILIVKRCSRFTLFFV